MTRADWDEVIHKHIADYDSSFLGPLADWAEEVNYPLAAAYRLMAGLGHCPFSPRGGPPHYWSDIAALHEVFKDPALLVKGAYPVSSHLATEVFLRLPGPHDPRTPYRTYSSFDEAAGALWEAYCFVGPLFQKGGAT